MDQAMFHLIADGARASQRRRSRGARLMTISLALVVSAGALAGLWLAFRPYRSPVRTTRSPQSPATLSPHIGANVPVGPFPQAIAVGDGDVWVSMPSQDPSTPDELIRVDPSTDRVDATIAVPGPIDGLITGYGAVWASAFERGIGGVVLRIDPQTDRIEATIPGAGGHFAVGDGSVWTSGSNDKQGRTSELSRIDPSTNRIVRTISLDLPAPYITFGEGAVWGTVPTLRPNSTVRSGDLIRIDPTTNDVAATIHVNASPGALAVGDGLVWVWGSVSSTEGVVRIDARTDDIVGQVLQLSEGFDPIGADQTGVWFLTGGKIGTLEHLNGRSLRVDAAMPLAQVPAFRFPPTAALDPRDAVIWVANYRRSVTRIDLEP